MLVFEQEPRRRVNPEIVVKPITLGNETDLDDLHLNHEEKIMGGHRFARAQDDRWVVSGSPDMSMESRQARQAGSW